MRLILVVLVFVCASLCGCVDQMEEVQRTGHGVNLYPTEREARAGY